MGCGVSPMCHSAAQDNIRLVAVSRRDVDHVQKLYVLVRSSVLSTTPLRIALAGITELPALYPDW